MAWKEINGEARVEKRLPRSGLVQPNIDGFCLFHVSLPGTAGFPNPARVEVDFIVLLSYNSGRGGIAYGPCTHY